MLGQRSRDANDTSARSLLQHLLNRELGDVDETFEVGGSESSEVFSCIVRERLHKEYTRVVDEHVD